MTTISELESPALSGEAVTGRHVRQCRDRGHATHTVNGHDSERCPRCGEVTQPLSATEQIVTPLGEIPALDVCAECRRLADLPDNGSLAYAALVFEHVERAHGYRISIVL